MRESSGFRGRRHDRACRRGRHQYGKAKQTGQTVTSTEFNGGLYGKLHYRLTCEWCGHEQGGMMTAVFMGGPFD